MILCVCRSGRLCVVRSRALHADLEQQRRYKRCDDDHEDDGRKHGAGYKPGHAAFLSNDQCDLTARYHAEADRDRVVGLKAREPCAYSAADDLRENSHYRESDSEENQIAVKPCKLGFYADRGKKIGEKSM